MAANFLSDLSNDIGLLLFGGDYYDVIIQAGEGQNMKEFFAHSLILGARSTYFKTALSKETAKKENGNIIYKMPNITPDFFELILMFLYTGIVNLYDLNGTQMLKLLVMADNMKLQKLSDYIQSYLIDNHAEYLSNEAVEILQTLFEYETFENLKNHCLKTIGENPKILFESPRFSSLEKDQVISFLRKDELEMEEFEIWNYILKWGLSKMPTSLDIDDVSHWASNDFEELEKILHDIIPHIRWFHIPAKVFWKKISILEPIFSKQLYRDIIGYHFDPNTTPNTLVLPQRNISSRQGTSHDISQPQQNQQYNFNNMIGSTFFFGEPNVNQQTPLRGRMIRKLRRSRR